MQSLSALGFLVVASWPVVTLLFVVSFWWANTKTPKPVVLPVVLGVLDLVLMGVSAFALIAISALSNVEPNLLEYWWVPVAMVAIIFCIAGLLNSSSIFSNKSWWVRASLLFLVGSALWGIYNLSTATLG